MPGLDQNNMLVWLKDLILDPMKDSSLPKGSIRTLFSTIDPRTRFEFVREHAEHLPMDIWTPLLSYDDLMIADIPNIADFMTRQNRSACSSKAVQAIFEMDIEPLVRRCHAHDDTTELVELALTLYSPRFGV